MSTQTLSFTLESFQEAPKPYSLSTKSTGRKPLQERMDKVGLQPSQTVQTNRILGFPEFPD